MPRVNNLKEHRTWLGIMFRCSDKNNNKKAASYVRRGITVSDEFKKFRVFLEHVGSAPTPTHQIDRIDNDRGYERGNLRWVTPKENANNRSNNRIYEYHGRRLKLIDIEPYLECKVSTFLSRISRGWKVEDAVKKGKFPERKIGELIEFDGISLSLVQWSERLNIPVSTLFCRLNQQGWSVEKSFTTRPSPSRSTAR